MDMGESQENDAIAGKVPVEVLEPSSLGTPVIFASPHSGRDYPAELLENSRLDRHNLRQSEDCYVDLLFNAAPSYGAPLLRALFPRAFVDVNRARNEIDPRMFADEVTDRIDTGSNRVAAGLGVIPRIVADGHDIYDRKLFFRDAQRRLSSCYDPYHKALSDLIDAAVKDFGMAVVIDCHSMPSSGTGVRFPAHLPDMVLGDRFGVSCAAEITDFADSFLSGRGLSVARNAPYAGGYVASSYGRPRRNVHVLQIEINRRLYLDEKRIARTDQFDDLRLLLSQFMESLAARMNADRLPRLAAE